MVKRPRSQEERLIEALRDDRPGNGAPGRDRQHRQRAHGALLVFADEEKIRPMISGRHRHRRRADADDPLRAGQDGRRHPARRGRQPHHARQRAAHARRQHRIAGDRHPAPHRRARGQADRRSGHLHLGGPRRGDGLPGRHPPHHGPDPDHPRQGRPGSADPGEVQDPLEPGLDLALPARVPGRGDAARRAPRCCSARR